MKASIRSISTASALVATVLAAPYDSSVLPKRASSQNFAGNVTLTATVQNNPKGLPQAVATDGSSLLRSDAKYSIAGDDTNGAFVLGELNANNSVSTFPFDASTSKAGRNFYYDDAQALLGLIEDSSDDTDEYGPPQLYVSNSSGSTGLIFIGRLGAPGVSDKVYTANWTHAEAPSGTPQSFHPVPFKDSPEQPLEVYYCNNVGQRAPQVQPGPTNRLYARIPDSYWDSAKCATLDLVATSSASITTS